MSFTSQLDAARLVTRRRASRLGRAALGLAAVGVSACNSDAVSLGGGDNPAGGTGACALGVDGVVEGSVSIDTQEGLDELAGCSEITGRLDITASRDFDLTPLASLRVVRETLRIDGTQALPALDHLDGLEALERVGELLLDNLDITNFEGLNSLAQVRTDERTESWEVITALGTVFINGCNRLNDLTGLENLVVWQDFSVSGAASLTSLRGLAARGMDQTLIVGNAPSLRDIASLGGGGSFELVRFTATGIESFVLDQPAYIRGLELRDNPALQSVESLGAIQNLERLVIHDNDALETLPELPYLDVTLRVLSITENAVLRAVPAWIEPDEGDFLPYENGGEPGDWTYFILPEFSLALISGNPQLTELALPTSFRFGGQVRIQDNASLATIDLSYLDNADDLSLVNNAALTQIEIPALKSVDALQVVDNPQLPPSVFANVQTFSADMQGNLAEPAP
ncbi:MAG TPA: hypothetical protein VMG12_15475 [Polyangiaceae bacterium]|nr:hypothetical protein [Polyangiaceae bacterium]